MQRRAASGLFAGARLAARVAAALGALLGLADTAGTGRRNRVALRLSGGLGAFESASIVDLARSVEPASGAGHHRQARVGPSFDARQLAGPLSRLDCFQARLEPRHSPRRAFARLARTAAEVACPMNLRLPLEGRARQSR